MGQYWKLINVDRREVFPNQGSVKMGGMGAVFTKLVRYLAVPSSRPAQPTGAEEEVPSKIQSSR